MLSRDPGEAYARFTSVTRAGLPAEQFARMVEQARRSFQGVPSPHVAHAYAVSRVEAGHDGRVVCTPPGAGQDVVRVTVTPAARQAHLLIDVAGAGNTWTFVVWLIGDRYWEVQNVYLGMTRMIGRSAADLWHAARAQAKRRHGFNAALLYAAADSLAERGPDLELGFRPEMRREIARLKPPRALQGKPTPTWHLGNKIYTILAVGPVGIQGRLYLMVNWQAAPWHDDKEIEARNRELYAGFARVFPEYAEIFAGLIVSAVETGGDRGYRSFYDASRPP